jgi:hypothetical protein
MFDLLYQVFSSSILESGGKPPFPSREVLLLEAFHPGADPT